MRSLLKADFFALIKSKVALAVLIICIGVPIFTVLIYVGLGKVIVDLIDSSEVDVSMTFSARFIMFSNFSMTNNIGLIIPIFAGILSMADIRNGTIRNKVIIGKNRTKIYISHLIVSTVFCVGMSLISFIFLCGGSLIFFNYGVAFNSAEAWNFAKCLIIGLLTFAYVASLSTFLALVSKSLPITIIFSLLIMIVLGIFGTIYTALPNDDYKYFFYLIPSFASQIVVLSNEISNEIFFFGLGSTLGFYAINSIVGLLIFNKSDLK